MGVRAGGSRPTGRGARASLPTFVMTVQYCTHINIGVCGTMTAKKGSESLNPLFIA